MTPRVLGGLLVATGVVGALRSLGELPPLPAAAWLLTVLGVVAATWARPLEPSERGARMLSTGLLTVAAFAGAGPLVDLVPAGVAAAAFLGVWARDPWRTWPLIPGGLLATVTVSGVIATFAPAWNPAPILFLGFGLTFSALYLLPSDRGGAKRWALFPALFFTVMTVVVNDPARSLPSWLLPALMIVAGLAMLAGTRRDR